MIHELRLNWKIKYIHYDFHWIGSVPLHCEMYIDLQFSIIYKINEQYFIMFNFIKKKNWYENILILEQLKSEYF